MDIEDRILISDLFQEYGSLLTQKQRATLHLYCEQDLSLFEIAERFGVSRQAIRDAVKHATDSLISYEKQLGLNGLRQGILSVLSSSRSAEEKLDEIRKLTE